MNSGTILIPVYQMVSVVVATGRIDDDKSGCISQWRSVAMDIAYYSGCQLIIPKRFADDEDLTFKYTNRYNLTRVTDAD